MANRSSRNQRLYNYIVNTLGVSKEMVMEHIESRVEELIDKHVVALLQSSRIENIVVNMIAKYINEGKVDSYCRSKSFEKIIDSQIKSVIENHMRERCKITFQYKSNSLKFMED